MIMQQVKHSLFFALALNLDLSTSFITSNGKNLPFIQENNKSIQTNRELLSKTAISSSVAPTTTANEKENEEAPMKITSPLKFIGPYPTLPLHFPNLSTSSQRERNVTGISLDFVVDTGANTNTINAQVASELKLDVIGEALPGYNTGGTMDGGATYLLGDCALDTPEQKKEVFMKELSASALRIASPTGAGLLSCAFLNCFQGGVKFHWNDEPSLTFYGDDHGMEDELRDMTRVPINIIEDVLLPSVTFVINGQEIPALLDTGSPITVLNAAAANLAGVETIQLPKNEESSNPFAKMINNVKNANSLAQAASKGDVLMIAGAGGQPVQLLKSNNEMELKLKGDGNGSDVSFSENKIYVGDLPGLAALGGLGICSPPAAVLGMDVLRRKPSMLYRMNEVYF